MPTLDGTGTIGGATTANAGAHPDRGNERNHRYPEIFQWARRLRQHLAVDLVETTSGDSDLIAVTGNLNIQEPFSHREPSPVVTRWETLTTSPVIRTLTGTFLLGATPWLDGEQKTLGSGLYEINYNNGGFITLTAVP